MEPFNLHNLAEFRYTNCQLYAPVALRVGLATLRRGLHHGFSDDILTPSLPSLTTSSADAWHQNMRAVFVTMKQHEIEYGERGREAFMLFSYNHPAGRYVVSAHFQVDGPDQLALARGMTFKSLTFRLLKVIDQRQYSGRPGTSAWWQHVLRNPQSGLLPQKELRARPRLENFGMLAIERDRGMRFEVRRQSRIAMV